MQFGSSRVGQCSPLPGPAQCEARLRQPGVFIQTRCRLHTTGHQKVVPPQPSHARTQDSVALASRNGCASDALGRQLPLHQILQRYLKMADL